MGGPATHARPAHLRVLFAATVAACLLASLAIAPASAEGPNGTPKSHRFQRDKATTTLAAAAPVPAAGFIDRVVIDGLDAPTALRFASDGRVLVAEKGGRVLVYPTLAASSPTVALDVSTAVHDYWDRGLLGLAVDPAFASNGRIYVLYAYDHILGSGAAAPRWGDSCPSPPGPTTDGCVISARLSTFTLSGNVAGSEHVLVEDWCQQFPSHSVGNLAFGLDGALYASAGDGASFNTADWGQLGGSAGSPTVANPCGDPPGSIGVADSSPSGRGGALRAQSLRRPSGEPVSLDGAIIRIDPATGAAAAGNPLAANPNANARRIVAHGFRNPFRFTFRPGTGELWIGDVGWNTREEIDRLVAPLSAPVENFGWPCYEGPAQQAGYSALTMCQSLYGTGPVAMPYYSYLHSAAVVTGDNCSTAAGSSITGLAFYQGAGYPAKYQGALLFADHTRNCIWAMLATNGLPDPSKRELLIGGAGNPVDLQTGPGGDLFYVDHEGGAVHRVSYNGGGNRPPSAVIGATPASGLAPFDVAFDGTGSSDPDPGDTISYAWDFTDNGTVDATTPTATFRYTTPAVYTARLTVTDSHGLSATTTRTVPANNTPPAVTISAPATTLRWSVGSTIPFGGSASDGQDGSVPPSAMVWQLILYHCTTATTCHTHLIETRAGVASGTFSAPDHAYPSYLEISLKATDRGGLSTTASVRIDPQIVALPFLTSPNRLAMVIDGLSSIGTSAVPAITRTVIVGSQNTITAPTPQVLFGIQFSFSRWSDALTSASRTIRAPATAWDPALMAVYRPTSADLYVSQSGVRSSTGGSVGWTVTVRNRGGGMNASSLVMRIAISGYLRTPTWSASGWSCGYSSTTRLLTCRRSYLGAGASSTITYRTSVARAVSYVSDTVSVSSSTRDVSTANNKVTTTVRLR